MATEDIPDALAPGAVADPVTVRARRQARAHPLDVAIFVLTPPFLPAVFSALRLARLVRLARLLRILRLGRTVKVSERLISTRGLGWATFVTMIVVVAAGMPLLLSSATARSWDRASPAEGDGEVLTP